MKTWNFTSLYFSQCLQEKTVIADLKASILFIIALRAISIFSTLNFSCWQTTGNAIHRNQIAAFLWAGLRKVTEQSQARNHRLLFILCVFSVLPLEFFALENWYALSWGDNSPVWNIIRKETFTFLDEIFWVCFRPQIWIKMIQLLLRMRIGGKKDTFSKQKMWILFFHCPYKPRILIFISTIKFVFLCLPLLKDKIPILNTCSSCHYPGEKNNLGTIRDNFEYFPAERKTCQHHLRTLGGAWT